LASDGIRRRSAWKHALKRAATTGRCSTSRLTGLLGLLAADEMQAIASAAMLLLVNLGPAGFAPLTAAMWTSEDDQLRVRTIEALGVCCLSHPEAVSILAAALNVVVEPRALGAIQRALCASMLILALRQYDSQPEPERRARKGSRRAASSRSRKTGTGANHPPPGDAVES
jgi:hypothetical protein